MDLLDQIIARSQAPGMAPSYDPNLVQNPSEEKQSLLEWLTGKRLKGGLKIIPRESGPVFPDVPQGPAPGSVPSMGAQAGLLTPGITGSGAGATSPDRLALGDPNYADRADNTGMQPAPGFPGAKVPLPAARPQNIPLPVERPREVDGSDNPPADGADMAARGARGPAGEDDAAAAPIRSPSPLQAGAGAPPAPAALPPQLQERAGMLGNGGIMPFLSRNSNMLLALGAGMMGPYSLGEGLGRASAYAIPGHEADLKQSMNIDQQRETYKALVQSGVPAQQALAAIGNPKILDALLPNYFQDQKYEIKEIKSKNPWGVEKTQLVAVDPRHPERGQINLGGQPTQIPTGGAPGIANIGGASPSAEPSDGFYAKGISDDNFSWDKTGQDFLNQFHPGVQAEIKDRLNGYVPASQNGRSPAAMQINMAAEKYGRDIGVPMDASSVAQRKTWAEGLAKDAANTPGGKGKAFHQGLMHALQASHALVDMHLSSGGVTGFEKEANIENWFKSLPAAQQERIARVQGIGQQLAGEMGTLNSANGGGVHERERTRELISDVFGSSKKAAGGLKGILEIMDGGIQALEEQRDQLFPNGNAPKGSEFMTDKERGELEQLRNNIAILEGKKPYPKRGAAEASAQGGAAPPPNVSTPAAAPSEPTAINPKTGARIVFRDGKWQPLQ